MCGTDQVHTSRCLDARSTIPTASATGSCGWYRILSYSVLRSSATTGTGALPHGECLVAWHYLRGQVKRVVLGALIPTLTLGISTGACSEVELLLPESDEVSLSFSSCVVPSSCGSCRGGAGSCLELDHRLDPTHAAIDAGPLGRGAKGSSCSPDRSRSPSTMMVSLHPSPLGPPSVAGLGGRRGATSVTTAAALVSPLARGGETICCLRSAQPCCHVECQRHEKCFVVGHLISRSLSRSNTSARTANISAEIICRLRTTDHMGRDDGGCDGDVCCCC